jgi:hypothetical protein
VNICFALARGGPFLGSDKGPSRHFIQPSSNFLLRPMYAGGVLVIRLNLFVDKQCGAQTDRILCS